MKKIKLFEEFILEAKLSSKQQAAYDFYYSHEEEYEAKHVADYHASQAEIYADPKADLVTNLDAHLANFKKQNKKYTALSKKAIRNQGKMEAEFDKLNPGMEKLKELMKTTAMYRGRSKDPLLGEYSKKFARDVISSDKAFLSTYDDMVDSYIRDFNANKNSGKMLMDELSSQIEELG